MKFYNKILKRKFYIFGSILFFFLIACKKKEKVVLCENITSFSKFPNEYNIYFDDLFEYKEGIPKVFRIVDSTLIIFNRSKNINAFLYNYDLKNEKLSKGYLKKGRGPNEAMGGSSFGIQGETLWIYDVTLKKMFFIDKHEAIKGQNLKFKSYPINEYFYEVVPTDNNSYLVSGKGDTKLKIQKINSSGEVIDEFGEFGYIPNNMPIDALKDAYHSFFYLKPTGDKLAVPYLYTDILEIYEMKKPHNNIAVQGPSGFELDFQVGKRAEYNYMKKNKEIRKTFLAGDVTNNYIYLAFSGLSYAEGKDVNYCKSILVFDWDGKPIKKLNLDRRILGLAVSQDDKTIYTYDADKGVIVKAKID